MQKLLEESLIFDVSVQYAGPEYGQKWKTIQKQMEKILLKDNIKPLRISPQKDVITSRAMNDKKYINNKYLKFQDKKNQYQNENGQGEFQNVKKRSQQLNKKSFQQKSPRISDSSSIRKLELEVLQSNVQTFEVIKRDSKSEKSDYKITNINVQLQLFPKNNKYRQKQTSQESSKLKSKEVKDGETSKNKRVQNQYKHDYIKQQKEVQNIEKLYNHSKSQYTSLKAQKFNFESLGNILSTKQTQNNKYVKRNSLQKTKSNNKIEKRSSLERKNTEPQINKVLETHKIYNEINAQNFIKNKDQEAFQRYEKRLSEIELKQKIKVRLRNLNHQTYKQKVGNINSKKKNQLILNENKQNTQIMCRNDDIIQTKTKVQTIKLNNYKSSKQYRKQIENLKKSIFETQSKKLCQKTEINLISFKKQQKQDRNLFNVIKLPQIKVRSQRSQTKNEQNDLKRQVSKYSGKFQKERPKAQSQLEKVHDSPILQKSRQQELHLFINKTKQYRDTLYSKKSSFYIHSENDSLTGQIEGDSKFSVKKVRLSSLIKGKMKISQLIPYEANNNQNIASNCLTSRKYQQKSGLILPRNRRLSTKSSRFKQNSCNSNDNDKLLSCQSDERTRIKIVSNYLLCQRINSDSPSKYQQQKNSHSKDKQNVEIKKNLDAQKNISLIKLSLNKNKNKLVLVRR